MSPVIFAQWFERQGYHVVQTKSCYWVGVFSRFYQAIPYHWTIEPTQEEIDTMFSVHRAIGLRYSAPIDSNYGATSYHIVYDYAGYSLDDLPKQTRKNVRKAQRCMTVEPISFQKLATEGWQARMETLERQNRSRAEKPSVWHRLCRSADGLPGFEAWAAVMDDKPVASLITFTCDNCCSILFQQSRSEYLNKKVNNFLIYSITSKVINRSSQNWIFSGIQSLDAPVSLDHFKFAMGFRPKPIRQAILVHRVLAPFFTKASQRVITGLKNMLPSSPILAKTEGICRFYMQGRPPAGSTQNII